MLSTLNWRYLKTLLQNFFDRVYIIHVVTVTLVLLLTVTLVMLLLQLCPLHQTHVSQLVKQGEQSSLYCQFCPHQVKVNSEVKAGQEGEVKQEGKASVAEAVSEGQGKPELNTDFKRKHTAENKLYVLNMFVMG